VAEIANAKRIEQEIIPVAA